MSNLDILLPYQKNWIKDDSTVKVIEKGRRTGITWSEAIDKTLLAASANGDDVWYIGYNKDMAFEFIQECSDWAKKWNNVVLKIMEDEELVDDKKILSYSVTFKSQWRITALSSRPSNLRGKQGVVIIDEAAFHEDLEGVLKAAFALTIWGGKVVIISTHNGEDNAFNTLVKDIRAGRLPYSLHRVTFMDAVQQGLYERISAMSKKSLLSNDAYKKIVAKSGKTLTHKEAWIKSIYDIYGDDAAEELDCVPARGGGTYFHQALLEGVMQDIPVIRFANPAKKDEKSFVDWSEDARKKTTDDWCEEHIAPLLSKLNTSLRHFAGMDVARRGDLSVIWLIAETQTLRLECPFVLELSDIPFSEQERVLFYLLDKLPRFAGVAIDSTGIGMSMAESARQRYGETRALEQSFNIPFYQESMPKAKRQIEDRNCTLPRDAGVLSDFRAIKVNKGVAQPPAEKNTSGDKLDKQKRHGDAAMGFVLAVWAREKLGDFGEPSYETLEKNIMRAGKTAY